MWLLSVTDSSSSCFYLSFTGNNVTLLQAMKFLYSELAQYYTQKNKIAHKLKKNKIEKNRINKYRLLKILYCTGCDIYMYGVYSDVQNKLSDISTAQ